MKSIHRAQPYIILFLLILLVLEMTRQKVSVSTQTCIFQTSTSKDITKAADSDPKSSSSSSSLSKSTKQNDDNDDNIPFRIWNPWPDDVDFPCVPGEPNYKLVKTQRSPADSGLLFTREMKTGSSTVAGILLRLAHDKGATLLRQSRNKKNSNNNNSNNNNNNNNSGDLVVDVPTPCRMRIDHSSARKMGYAHRDKKRSFLISLLRNPTKRAISHFFHFRVSQMKKDPTDQNFITFFHEEEAKWSNYYTKDLTMRPIDLDRKEKDDDDDDKNNNNNDHTDDESHHHETIVKDILKEYNFIAITERMDESLVVFKNLLDLSYEDILYMSAKQHGSFTAGPQDRPCIYLTPSFVTDGMKEFFMSEYWKNYIRVDDLLYRAAMKSLDRTMDALGRKEIEKQVQIFQQAKEYAQTKCFHRTIYRCNFRGENIGATNSTCYMWDIGCGYECLNEISVERDVLNS